MSAAKTFPPTPQQKAVCLHVFDTKKNLMVVARAGCGKSSTLKLLVKFLVDNDMVAGPYDSIYLCAFNAPIAEELKVWAQDQGYARSKVGAGTMHGVGMGSWMKVAPNAVVDEKKVPKIFDREYPEAPEGQPEPAYIKYREFVIKAVGYAKQRAFGVVGAIEDRSLWFDMVDHFSIDETLADGNERSNGTAKGEEIDLGYAVELAINVYKISLAECRETIDFSDMILAPLYFKAKIRNHKFVLLDEAQDTNPARRALALAMISPYGGRLIAVGDDYQAIYGFTGADSDAMDLLAKATNAAILPLNKTFRCGKAIVKVAQQWVPDIQAADSNAAGVVREVPLVKPDPDYQGGIFWDEQLKPTDAILCRNTKPLVKMAFNLLRRGIGCRIEGRKDVAAEIVGLIRRFKSKRIETLINRVQTYQAREVQKALATGKEDQAARIDDKCETIYVVASAVMGEGLTDVDQLIARFTGMFGDTEEGRPPANVLTLSTVHKSKGREWDRVYILGRNRYMPNRWARRAWQIQAETNLMYVAVTRAKKELVDVYVEEENKA